MRIVNAKFLAASLFVLLLPVVASATFIADLDVAGDCIGWSVDTTIRFRSDVFEADVDLVVELTDLDGNVLETQTMETTVSRDEGSYYTQVYNFADEWTYYGPAGRYHVVATVTVTAVRPPDGVDVTTQFRAPKFTCSVVSNEDSTWSAVKGLYR